MEKDNYFMSNVDERSTTLIPKVFFVLFLLYVLSCFELFFSFSMSRAVQIITIVALFGYLLLSVISSDNTANIGKGVLFICLYVLIYRLTGYSQAGWGNLLMQISFFVSIVASIYCINRMDQRYVVLLYYIVVFFLLLMIIKDILLNQSFDYSNNEDIVEIDELGSNVGWTPFSTTLLFLYCISLLVLTNCSGLFVKLFHAMVALISAYYLVFYSARGSVTILLFLSTILLLYWKFSTIDFFFKIICLGGILILLVAVLFDTNTIFNFLIRISPNDRLTDRLYDIINVYNEGITEESFSGRYDLEVLSIRTWLQSPRTFLFGIGDHRLTGIGMDKFYMSGIGGHSEIIDSLARFGVIGFFVMSVLYYRICIYILSLFEDEIVKKQVLMILIVFVLTAFTKTVLFHIIGIVFLFLLPIVSVQINKEKELL